MLPGALYIVRGQADGELSTDAGERFLGGSADLLTQDWAAALTPWMSLKLDTSYLKAYGGKVESWTLFRVGEKWFVCRLGEAGPHGDGVRPPFLAHAWSWKPDPEIPLSHPGYLFGENHFFLPERQPEALSITAYNPSWAGVVRDNQGMARDLLAHLFDACSNQNALVVLTDTENNDWRKGSDLSPCIAFAWAALPFEWKRDCLIQTSCLKPSEAILQRRARLITYDYRKNPELKEIQDKGWIVWHPGRQQQWKPNPSNEAVAYADRMLNLAAEDVARIPVVTRLIGASDTGKEALAAAMKISRDMPDATGRLRAGLVAAGRRLSSARDAAPTLPHLAQICAREKCELDVATQQALWNLAPTYFRQLVTLDEPVVAGCQARLMWAYCQAFGNEQEKARLALERLCDEKEGQDAVVQKRQEWPEWHLWHYLPPHVEIQGADWESDLAAPIVEELRKKWNRNPGGTVQHAVNYGYWHRWARAWLHTVDYDELRRELGFQWFRLCEEDFLLEDWYLALQLLRPITPEVLRRLWNERGPNGRTVPPTLNYLEEKQETCLLEVGKDLLKVDVRPYLSEPFSIVFLGFGIGRDGIARELRNRLTRMVWPPAPAPDGTRMTEAKELNKWYRERDWNK